MTEKRTYHQWLIITALLLCFTFSLFFALKIFTGENGSSPSMNEKLMSQDRFYQHTPDVVWLEDSPESVVHLDKYELQNFESTYTKAWYCLNTSIKQKNTECLHDYFGEILIEKIKSSLNEQVEFEIEQVDLSHQLKLNQMTLDRQVISLTDSNVRMLKHLYSPKGKIISKTDESSSFDLVFRREDGRWKIIHWVEKTEKLMRKSGELVNTLFRSHEFSIQAIRGVNYYPSDFPWKEFWRNFDKVNLQEDLNRIKDLNLNSLRIFIPYEIFGGGHPDENRLQDLETLLDLCEANELKVILTLFDFPVGFDLANYPAYRKHLKIILNRFKDHPAIVSWNLKNEPDIDYQYYDTERVKDWLAFIVDEAKKIAPSEIFTIGWADPRNASYLSNHLDYVSIHYYENPNNFKSIIHKLQEQIGNKQILVEEFGQSSYSSFWFPFSSSEKEQAVVINQLDRQMTEMNIPSLVWCLNDYQNLNNEVFGWKPWVRKAQSNYGLYDVQGRLKLSGQVMQDPKLRLSLTFIDRLRSWHAFVLGLFFLMFYLVRRMVRS